MLADAGVRLGEVENVSAVDVVCGTSGAAVVVVAAVVGAEVASVMTGNGIGAMAGLLAAVSGLLTVS